MQSEDLSRPYLKEEAAHEKEGAGMDHPSVASLL